MGELDKLEIDLKSNSEASFDVEYDLDRIIYDLDSRIDLLKNTVL